MKKLMMVLFMTMGVLCFADYKSDFHWSITDSAKIEKGLAEATQDKNSQYINYYSILKIVSGKSFENITYDELKKTFADNKFSDFRFIVSVRMIPNLHRFSSNVLNDKSLLTSKKNINYINLWYSNVDFIFNAIGAKVWREKFVNLETLNDLSQRFDNAKMFFEFYKEVSIKFTSDEIKADTVLMKRAWYSNITVSDGWKQLLVQVELLNKSVQ